MELPTTYRLSSTLRVFLLITAIATVGFGAFEISHGLWLAFSDRADPGIGVLLGGAGLVLAAFGCWRMARVRLDVDEGGLQIVNMFYAETLPWYRVRRFGVGGKLIHAELTDGRFVPIYAIQKSAGRARTYIAADLNEVVDKRRPSMGLPP